MVEEAAGTSMYETKRDQTNKLIEKKDAKLNEMDAVSEVFQTNNMNPDRYHQLFFITLPHYQSFISIGFPFIWLS